MASLCHPCVLETLKGRSCAVTRPLGLFSRGHFERCRLSPARSAAFPLALICDGAVRSSQPKAGFLPLWPQVTEVFSQTRNGERVRITITLTNELPPTSPTCLQFYNIIFRRCMGGGRAVRC